MKPTDEPKTLHQCQSYWKITNLTRKIELMTEKFIRINIRWIKKMYSPGQNYIKPP